LLIFLKSAILKLGDKMDLVVVLIVFTITYFLIITGKFKRSTVAFSAGMAILLFKIISNYSAEKIGFYVDFNTLGILMGMMIIVGILKSTGFFEYVAIYIVKFSRGNVRILFFFFMITIAFFSALLDNVTTILLFSPIIFLVSDSLEISPKPYIILTVLFANIGGTATIIGDPPNILIGSASSFGFIDFVIYLGPLVAIITFISLLFSDRKYFKPVAKKSDSLKKFSNADPKKAIKSEKELKKALFVFVLVIFGFLTHDVFNYDASIIALSGAAFLMLISNKNFAEITKEIEWDTIFFFVGLFIISFSLQEVGISSFLSGVLGNLSSTPILLYLTIIWITAIAGSFIGAVPVVTIMIPIIQTLIISYNVSPEIWWSLSIGACFGGSGAITGAASNMVGVGLLEQHTNERFGYINYMKYSLPITLLSLIIGSIYTVIMTIL